ncbi:MAG: 3-dehydroquinate synthase [Clostridiaceae bacterium]|nr:3-dehydroquinate synthase [Clostridiaceae bacterium]
MVKLNVDLADRSYPIYVSTDFSGLGMALRAARLNGKLMIITDSNVSGYYLKACTDELEAAGAEVYSHVFQAGEKNKTLDTVQDIYRQLTARRFDRNSSLIALGGGVAGDITGFAAATFMRGINFIQIPTSLLAQADSSIGGKTGVDFEGSKNMVGAFYQPRFVYINVKTISTLPGRELSSGLAEVIKHGLILNAEFYDYLKHSMDKIFSFDENTLQYVTKMNCSIKKSIVEQDEYEGGLRAILNFGHTIGHAVESACEFSLLHGECVAIGISGAFRLAYRMGMLSMDEVTSVEDTLSAAGLPIRAPGLEPDEVYARMLQDKKVKDGRLRFILPKAIGEVISCTIEDERLIKEVIRELQ